MRFFVLLSAITAGLTMALPAAEPVVFSDTDVVVTVRNSTSAVARDFGSSIERRGACLNNDLGGCTLFKLCFQTDCKGIIAEISVPANPGKGIQKFEHIDNLASYGDIRAWGIIYERAECKLWGSNGKSSGPGIWGPKRRKENVR